MLNNSRDFIDSFLKFEAVNNMFDVKVYNIKVWNYIRFTIYTGLLSLFDIDKSVMQVDILKGEYKKGIKEYIRENIICNQRFVTHRDVLIIPHERKYKTNDDYYRCIYTNLIDETIKQSHYILDSQSVFGDYTPQKSKNVIYSKKDKFEKKENNNNTYKKCKIEEFETKIIQPLENYFKISIPQEIKKQWKEILDNYLYRRRYLVSYYTYILNRVKPKVIMMVVSYSFDRMILCEIAKEKSIPVVELMHGVMTKGYLPYCFPKRMQLESFPDFIFTFGKHEYTEKLPISSKRVLPVGFPELEQYTKCKKTHKRKQILFISQGQVEIAQIAKELSDSISDDEYEIIYKLHPKEYASWQKDLGEYLRKPNIQVAGDYNHTVYEYLSQADWVVGIYSTVLFEATAFDTKIAILKSSMSINVEKLFQNGHAVLVDGAKELKEAIEKNEEMNNPTDEFFTSNSLYNIQHNVDRIIKYYDRKCGKRHVKFSP